VAHASESVWQLLNLCRARLQPCRKVRKIGAASAAGLFKIELPHGLFSLWGGESSLARDETPQAEACATQSPLQFLCKFYGDCQLVDLTRAVCMANFTNRFNYVVEDFPNLEV
jgi:hypothetical protein